MKARKGEKLYKEKLESAKSRETRQTKDNPKKGSYKETYSIKGNRSTGDMRTLKEVATKVAMHIPKRLKTKGYMSLYIILEDFLGKLSTHYLNFTHIRIR